MQGFGDWGQGSTGEQGRGANELGAGRAVETRWRRQDQQSGTRIGIVWTLSRALGPARESIDALESLDRCIVSGYWEPKGKCRLSSKAGLVRRANTSSLNPHRSRWGRLW